MVMSLLARPLHEKIAIETILRDRKATFVRRPRTAPTHLHMVS
jgi:hypothetical protein